MNRRMNKKWSARGGYTLMEMLVVQGVIVAMVALSWPAVSGSLDKNRLLSSAKQVRTELSRARLKAIETGAIQQFRYVPGGRQIEVGSGLFSSDDSGLASKGDSYADSDSISGNAFSDADVHSESLAEGTHFAMKISGTSADGQFDRVNEWSDETDIQSDLAEEDWSAPIIFYPNGRTSNAMIRVVGPRDFYIDVTLRGQTGAAKVGKFQRNEETE